MVEVRVERYHGVSLPRVESNMWWDVEGVSQRIEDCWVCEPQWCFSCLARSFEWCDHRPWALCEEHEWEGQLLELLGVPEEERGDARRSQMLFSDDDAEQFAGVLRNALTICSDEVYVLAEELPLEDDLFHSIQSLICSHVTFRPWGPILQTTEFARDMLPEIDPRLFDGDAYVLIDPTNVPEESDLEIHALERLWLNSRFNRLEFDL